MEGSQDLPTMVAEFHSNYSLRQSLNRKLQAAPHPDKAGIVASLAKVDARDAVLTQRMRYFYDDILVPEHRAALQLVRDAETRMLDQKFILAGLQDDVKRAQKAELEAWRPLRSLARDAGRNAPERPDNRRSFSGQRKTYSQVSA